jgi:hypothetical protein
MSFWGDTGADTAGWGKRKDAIARNKAQMRTKESLGIRTRPLAMRVHIKCISANLLMNFRA